MPAHESSLAVRLLWRPYHFWTTHSLRTCAATIVIELPHAPARTHTGWHHELCVSFLKAQPRVQRVHAPATSMHCCFRWRRHWRHMKL